MSSFRRKPESPDESGSLTVAHVIPAEAGIQFLWIEKENWIPDDVQEALLPQEHMEVRNGRVRDDEYQHVIPAQAGIS